MVSSDQVDTGRTRRVHRVLIVVATVLLGIVGFVALLLGAAWWFAVQYDQKGREESVAVIEEAFVDHRAGFEATAAYITALSQSEPDAIEIGWTSRRIYVIDGALEETRRDATEAEDQLRHQARGAILVNWQAKDDGRIFFSFRHEASPINYLMFDPQDRDAKEFAKEHGFSWERDLGDGWSIPGSIPNDDDADAMWVARWK